MLYDITNSILYIEIPIPPEPWLEPGNYRLRMGGGGRFVQKKTSLNSVDSCEENTPGDRTS